MTAGCRPATGLVAGVQNAENTFLFLRPQKQMRIKLSPPRLCLGSAPTSGVRPPTAACVRRLVPLGSCVCIFVLSCFFVFGCVHFLCGVAPIGRTDWQ